MLLTGMTHGRAMNLWLLKFYIIYNLIENKKLKVKYIFIIFLRSYKFMIALLNYYNEVAT